MPVRLVSEVLYPHVHVAMDLDRRPSRNTEVEVLGHAIAGALVRGRHAHAPLRQIPLSRATVEENLRNGALHVRLALAVLVDDQEELVVHERWLEARIIIKGQRQHPQRHAWVSDGHLPLHHNRVAMRVHLTRETVECALTLELKTNNIRRCLRRSENLPVAPSHAGLKRLDLAECLIHQVALPEARPGLQDYCVARPDMGQQLLTCL